MTAIRIDSFMGEAPKLSNRLLPHSAAASARNARLLSGELRGLRTPDRIHRFGVSNIKNAKRLYKKSNNSEVWLGLLNADSDIAKGPLINDSIDRYYYTGEDSFVSVNSINRIEAGDTAYRLGTPAPTTAASIVVLGGSGSIETRAYTYTFVNSWNEESAPAPVVQVDGFIDGSWDLSGLETVAPDMADRLPITTKRIYRTVTGLATVSYYHVADISIGTATYSDTSSNAAVALNTTLQSFFWEPPLDTLQGLIAHPAGFLAAFDGNDVYFSERYRPHAWPSTYALSVEHAVVGLSVYNNMITVLTKGQPYFLQGTRPENLTPTKSEAAEPCLSKASIASTLQGVLYASPNGLVLFNESGPTNVTNNLLSIEEWYSYAPSFMRGAQYGTQYIGYYSSSKAIKYSPTEQLGIFSIVDQFDNVSNILTDDTTGEVWLLRDGDVYRWEPASGVPLHYSWTSKVFDFTRPVNFGAYHIKAVSSNIVATPETEALYTQYNYNRFHAGEGV